MNFILEGFKKGVSMKNVLKSTLVILLLSGSLGAIDEVGKGALGGAAGGRLPGAAAAR